MAQTLAESFLADLDELSDDDELMQEEDAQEDDQQEKGDDEVTTPHSQRACTVLT